MGRDLAVWASVAVTAGAARLAVYTLARRRGWRLRRWGVLLTWRRPVESCYRCGTDQRIAPGKATPYRHDADRGSGRVVTPLCVRCWLELPPDGRLGYYGLMLERWRRDGVYGPEGAFDRDGWDEDRVALYSAVRAGL